MCKKKLMGRDLVQGSWRVCVHSYSLLRLHIPFVVELVLKATCAKRPPCRCIFFTIVNRPLIPIFKRLYLRCLTVFS